MCNLFSTVTNEGDIALLAEIPPEYATAMAPRYTVRPNTPIRVVVQGRKSRGFLSCHWGFVPGWAKVDWSGPRPFNARAETAATGSMFSAAFARSRGLVFADGFYEPAKPAQSKWAKGQPRVYNYFYSPTETPIAIAALFSRWGNTHTATLITVSANDVVAGTGHDRMPAILDRDTWGVWLYRETPDKAALREMLAPAPTDTMTCHRVDPGLLYRRDGDDYLDDARQMRAVS